jgi:hypothetical protein
MRPFTLHRFLVSIAVTAIVTALPLCAQSSGAEASAFAAPGTPTAVPAGAKPKKQSRHDLKVPRSKQISEQITDGMLSVDGLVTKVQLNYEIHHASRLYFFAPGIGTVVLSRANMPGATVVKDAFNGSEISFTADGHSFNLSSEVDPELSAGQPEKKGKLAKLAKLQLPKTPQKFDGYIVIDYASADLDRYPMFGYGDTMTAPYTWPLSKPQPKDTYAHYVAPPPPPSNMLPRTKATPAAAVVAATPAGAALTTVAAVN